MRRSSGAIASSVASAIEFLYWLLLGVMIAITPNFG
jgi:hypothetical protein